MTNNLKTNQLSRQSQGRVLQVELVPDRFSYSRGADNGKEEGSVIKDETQLLVGHV